tara:strand:+ start:879 stop:1115 length:237 start_codon:yes stop_codon:yes gene_type:complete
MDDSLPLFKIGTLIRDGDKIGIIYREIKSGTWTEEPLFNWRTNYEIFYEDGTVCVMGSDTIARLVDMGKIEVIEGSNE